MITNVLPPFLWFTVYIAALPRETVASSDVIAVFVNTVFSDEGKILFKNLYQLKGHKVNADFVALYE